MVDVRGDVLRPPHGTTPAAVKANKNHKMSSFKSNENIHKKGESLTSDPVMTRQRKPEETYCNFANFANFK